MSRGCRMLSYLRRSIPVLIGFRPLAIAALVWPAAVLAGPTDPAAIAVSVAQAKLVKLPERVATIVVGNPMIADVAHQNNKKQKKTKKNKNTTKNNTKDLAG